MKKLKISIIFIAILLALAVFTSCNASEDSYVANGGATMAPEAGDSVTNEKADGETERVRENADVKGKAVKRKAHRPKDENGRQLEQRVERGRVAVCGRAAVVIPAENARAAAEQYGNEKQQICNGIIHKRTP